MKKHEEIMAEIKQALEKLNAFGNELIEQSSNCDPFVFCGNKNSGTHDRSIPIMMMAQDIVYFSSQLLDENYTETSFPEWKKKKLVYDFGMSMDDYLDLECLSDQNTPEDNRFIYDQIGDLCISIIRGFFRILDILYTYLSGSNKTIAQRAEEKVLSKYSFLASDATELRKEMDRSSWINYSESGQLLHLARKTYKKDITELHTTLTSQIKTLETLFADLNKSEPSASPGSP